MGEAAFDQQQDAAKQPTDDLSTDELDINDQWTTAKDRYQDWRQVEEKSRKDREKASRKALAACYVFAAKAISNKAELEIVKKVCRVTAKKNTSPFYVPVKICFGKLVKEEGTETQVWEPINDQLAHKYVKVLDYAAFREIVPADMETWLSKDGEGNAKSFSKRYAEAVGSSEYKEYCKGKGYYVKEDENVVLEISKEQQRHLNQFIQAETDLEPGKFTAGVNIQIKQIDATGHVRIIELPDGIKGITDNKAIQELINKVTEVEPSAKGFKRLMSILRLASIIKLRKNDTKGRIIALNNSEEGMTVKIAHNDAKGSIQLELTFDAPDADLPVLETTLNEEFIGWVPVLYTSFGGEWKAIQHEVEEGKKEPFIEITPPGGVTVSERIAAINTKKNDTAEKAAKKRAEANNHKYEKGKAEIKAFHRPAFTTLGAEDKTLLVPLTNLVKDDKKSKKPRFAILRDDVKFNEVVAKFSPETVKALIAKESQVIKAKIDNPADATKKIARVQGDLFSLRITHARIGFCDMDGSIVGHLDQPDRLGETDFHKEYILAKGSLMTVLETMRSIMPNASVKFEFSETLMRLTAKEGKKEAKILLPAATSLYSGNTAAFTFEHIKPEEKTDEETTE